MREAKQCFAVLTAPMVISPGQPVRWRGCHTRTSSPAMNDAPVRKPVPPSIGKVSQSCDTFVMVRCRSSRRYYPTKAQSRAGPCSRSRLSRWQARNLPRPKVFFGVRPQRRNRGEFRCRSVSRFRCAAVVAWTSQGLAHPAQLAEVPIGLAWPDRRRTRLALLAPPKACTGSATPPVHAASLDEVSDRTLPGHRRSH